MISSLKEGPIAAFGLALVGLVGIVVLSAMSKTVPTELWALEAAVLGGGLGITNPTGSAGASSSTSTATGGSIDQAAGA